MGFVVLKLCFFVMLNLLMSCNTTGFGGWFFYGQIEDGLLEQSSNRN